MSLELPIIYLLPNRLSADELDQLEEQIPTLTYDINEAEVLLGKVSQKGRALFELRHRKLLTEEIPPTDNTSSPRIKRRGITDPAQEVLGADSDTPSKGYAGDRTAEAERAPEKTIKVVKLSWLTDSVKKGAVQPFDDYLVYEGRKVPRTAPPPPSTGVLVRATADAGSSQTSPSSRFGQSSFRRNREHHDHAIKPPPMLHRTTTEHDIDLRLPPIPDYLHTTYSCQRPTPVNSPNEAFIRELKKIRKTRTLIGDKIGVRAYSSSIATIAAYPYTLSTPQGKSDAHACPRGYLAGAKRGHMQKSQGSRAVEPRLQCCSRS